MSDPYARTRSADDAPRFPTHISNVVQSLGLVERDFPFLTWAAQIGFKPPKDSLRFFTQCGSAAEAYFVRPFAERDGVVFEECSAVHAGARLRLQVPCGTFRIDAVLTSAELPDFRLAIEVDGLGFHHAKAEQIAADYLRQRRIVWSGYTVIRFTAQEAFADPAECWRQIDAILEARRTP